VVNRMQEILTQLGVRGAVERLTEPGRRRTAALHVADPDTNLQRKFREVIDATDRQLTNAISDGQVNNFITSLRRTAQAAGIGPGTVDE
jgi:hypothetical protein